MRIATGAVFVGANMENASYGLTVCAEVAALTAANTAGARALDTIAAVGGSLDAQTDNAVTPCGRCRQLILEAAQLVGKNVRVLAANADASVIEEYD